MLIRVVGVLDPLELAVAFSESTAGVPVAGRRFEMMPVVVRLSDVVMAGVSEES